MLLTLTKALSGGESAIDRLCSDALSRIGEANIMSEPLSEEEVDRLYELKSHDEGAVLLLARSYFRLGVLHLLRKGVYSRDPKIADYIEAMFYDILVPGVRKFDKAKRSELTKNKPTKYNLASFLVGQLRFEAPKVIRRIRNAKEINITDLIPETLYLETSLASHNGELEDVIEKKEDHWMAKEILKAAREYLDERSRIATSTSDKGRLELQKIIYERVMIYGEQLSLVAHSIGKVHGTLQFAQTALLEAVKKKLKKKFPNEFDHWGNERKKKR